MPQQKVPFIRRSEFNRFPGHIYKLWPYGLLGVDGHTDACITNYQHYSCITGKNDHHDAYIHVYANS